MKPEQEYTDDELLASLDQQIARVWEAIFLPCYDWERRQRMDWYNELVQMRNDIFPNHS